MRGITLEEIAAATKIGSRSLRALETEDFEKLPGGIFNKGFVRSYARYLGIDAEQAVTDFLAAEALFYQNTPAAAGNINAEVAAPRSGGSWLMIALAVAIVAAVIFGGWKYWTSRSAARNNTHQTSHSASSDAHEGTGVPAASDNARVGTGVPARAGGAEPRSALAPQGSQPSASSAAATNDAHVGTGVPARTGGAEPRSALAAPEISVPDPAGFVVSIRARKPSWVTINADGKPIMNAMLDADAERSVRARNRMTLTLGNAGGIALSYNGKPLAVASQENQVKTLVFTPQGLSQ